MTFFSRPTLENLQFKQLTDSVLTLSGQTQIATISGLTLANSLGGNIIITAEGATGSTAYGKVLTYDGVSGKIKLMPSAASGTSIYNPPYPSPATVSLGGITPGYVLTGKTISCILGMLLVPTVNPTLVPPTNTFTISPSTTPVEVGTILNITGCSTFNRGSIYPQYSSASAYRSGLPYVHIYNTFGLIPKLSAVTTNLTNSYSFAPYTALSTPNTISACVMYSAGVQPKNSAGGNYCSALPSGVTTPIISRTINGIYPWFYGSGATVPTVNQALINGARKCLSDSSADISVTNYNVNGNYIWFAIPSGSTGSIGKTKWLGWNSPSNCGTIPGDLFKPEAILAINSPQSCWFGIRYRFYVSNYPTIISYGMTFKIT